MVKTSYQRYKELSNIRFSLELLIIMISVYIEYYYNTNLAYLSIALVFVALLIEIGHRIWIIDNYFKLSSIAYKYKPIKVRKDKLSYKANWVLAVVKNTNKLGYIISKRKVNKHYIYKLRYLDEIIDAEAKSFNVVKIDKK